MNPEITQLLTLAHDEIIRLRQQIAALEPRAHAYDTIAKFSRLMPREEVGGHAPDIAFAIRRAVEGERHQQEETRRRLEKTPSKPAEETSSGKEIFDLTRPIV
jgi:hypothetical protein